MPILKKLKLKRKTLKVGCFNNPFLILIGILLIAVIIVILYHYFYKKSNTIERFYQNEGDNDLTTSEPTTSEPTTSEPTTSEPTTSEPARKSLASDKLCQPDIRGNDWKKRDQYITDLEESGELEIISDCCEFNNDKEKNDAFKGYNMHCEAAFTMKLENCRKKGIGKDKDGNCMIESGSYKAKNTEELKEWRWRPTGYMASA